MQACAQVLVMRPLAGLAVPMRTGDYHSRTRGVWVHHTAHTSLDDLRRTTFASSDYAFCRRCSWHSQVSYDLW